MIVFAFTALTLILSGIIGGFAFLYVRKDFLTRMKAQHRRFMRQSADSLERIAALEQETQRLAGVVQQLVIGSPNKIVGSTMPSYWNKMEDRYAAEAKKDVVAVDGKPLQRVS